MIDWKKQEPGSIWIDEAGVTHKFMWWFEWTGPRFELSRNPIFMSEDGESYGLSETFLKTFKPFSPSPKLTKEGESITIECTAEDADVLIEKVKELNIKEITIKLK